MVVGQWQRIANDPDLQRSSHCLSVVKDSAYVFGGELEPRVPRDNKVFEICLQDLAKPGIRAINNDSHHVPSPRVGSASASINASIYLFSGRGGPAMEAIEEHGQLHCFDAATSTWAKVVPADSQSPYPCARSFHCMTSDKHSRLFVHAGCPQSGRLADLWNFDIGTKTWTQLPEAPSPQRGGTSIAYTDGKLYRMNGFDGKTEQGGSLDIFDLASGSWSTKMFAADGKAGPEARSVSMLVSITISGSKKLVTAFGEGHPSSLGHAGAGTMFHDWWVYDIASDKWEQGQNMDEMLPEQRGWFDAAALDNGTVIVAGGLSESNQRLQDVWLLSF